MDKNNGKFTVVLFNFFIFARAPRFQKENLNSNFVALSQEGAAFLLTIEQFFPMYHIPLFITMIYALRWRT